ncbi:unnamed protein product [Boreogadus saida]
MDILPSVLAPSPCVPGMTRSLMFPGLSLPLLPFVIYCKPSCCGVQLVSLRLPLPGVMESSARWLMPLEPSAIPSACEVALWLPK